MQNDKFDLTVVVCVYNGSKYIVETLNSLYQQTYKKFNLLVINDCSTDQTLNTVKIFISDNQWDNCKVVSLDTNVGLARARKHAEQLVQTEFVLFFDADDVAYPDMLARQYGVLSSQPDCMGVSCYCEYIDPDSHKIGGGIFLGPKTAEEFYKASKALKLMFLPPATMFRLGIAKAAGGRAVDGFPEGKIRYQDMCEDLDLWTRMSDFYVQGLYFLVITDVLFGYRKHASSVSSSSVAMNQRMRHIKNNLKLRRSGLKDLTFIQYLSSISTLDNIKNTIHDKATNHYKMAGFHYMKKSYIQFLLNLIAAMFLSPKYVWRKINNNLLKK